MINKVLILSIAVIGLLGGIFLFRPQVERNPPPLQQKEIDQGNKTDTIRIDFSQYSSLYRFSAQIPSSWKIQYIPQIDAVNIYNPDVEGKSSLDKSQLFIRNFEADRFLTLSTVNILAREEITVGDHAAVRYEIEKKSSTADFPRQPSWRNKKHGLIDVRLSENSPSLFYVFAANPLLSESLFYDIIRSLIFHNDPESFALPLADIAQRAVKKPFGLYVIPSNSPVEPERFSGYHTGLDFEIIAGEERKEVTVGAFCGGAIRTIQYAAGYGGVVTQECLLKKQILTIIYGHLKLSSVELKSGEYAAAGTLIGLLGAGGSQETDGERKHLHLGALKGRELDIRGYVDSESEITKWLDPKLLLNLSKKTDN